MVFTVVKDSGAWVWTPGVRRASWAKLRPFSGSATTVDPVMTSPTVAFSVCRMGFTPTTSMVSVTSPISSLRSTRAVWPPSSVSGLVTTVLKPCDSARTT